MSNCHPHAGQHIRRCREQYQEYASEFDPATEVWECVKTAILYLDTDPDSCYRALCRAVAAADLLEEV